VTQPVVSGDRHGGPLGRSICLIRRGGPTAYDLVLPLSRHRPVAVTEGSLTRKVNEIGVRLWTGCPPDSGSLRHLLVHLTSVNGEAVGGEIDVATAHPDCIEARRWAASERLKPRVRRMSARDVNFRRLLSHRRASYWPVLSDRVLCPFGSRP
jgi:hypothetical protein